MDWLNTLNAVAQLATAIAVFVAGYQILQTKRQAKTEFEDNLSKEYREIALTLPLEALLGEKLEGDEIKKYLANFYRYFDFTNYQIFLNDKKRINARTWAEWENGIKSNLNKPAFRDAWEQISERMNKSIVVDFDEIRRFLPVKQNEAEKQKTELYKENIQHLGRP